MRPVEGRGAVVLFGRRSASRRRHHRELIGVTFGDGDGGRGLVEPACAHIRARLGGRGIASVVGTVARREVPADVACVASAPGSSPGSRWASLPCVSDGMPTRFAPPTPVARGLAGRARMLWGRIAGREAAAALRDRWVHRLRSQRGHHLRWHRPARTQGAPGQRHAPGPFGHLLVRIVRRRRARRGVRGNQRQARGPRPAQSRRSSRRSGRSPSRAAYAWRPGWA